MVIAIWITIRAGMHIGIGNPTDLNAGKPQMAATGIERHRSDTAVGSNRSVSATDRIPKLAPGEQIGARLARKSASSALSLRQNAERPRQVAASPKNWIFAIEPESKNLVQPAAKHRAEPAIPPIAQQPSTSSQTNSARRWSLYAYGFWRQGEAANAIAPAAQYGGSQAGLIGSYRLQDSPYAPALFLRTSSGLEDTKQAEIAAGLRWRALQQLPVEISIERRFRRGAADAVAAYVAGGWNSMPLPYRFKLSGYGQAGILRADQGAKKLSHFYDGQIRAERKIAQVGKVKIMAGGGAWAGGQRGVDRLDLGPTASVELGLAQTSFRLSADYRFRAAGNARPGSGPAITLSAGY